ncbi:hypothetical protein [Spirosoma sordidisoli]|uniref:Uncharacterized protein n=1 Tax=Spirosoma sordidisoli TaxID=2502893 RepID=A0A4Q2UUY3_9BACT|nr:hypothetical protein [Spirosoma sordidisoli]RYC70719.1 hypothetical protein EQG79_00775 [Spirosoma sordidisoli]
MTPKEKAIELTLGILPYAYCYMGSGMLTNDYDQRVALDSARMAASNVLDSIAQVEQEAKLVAYWLAVKSELPRITFDDLPKPEKKQV